MFFRNAEIDAINKSSAVVHYNSDGKVIEVNDQFLKALGYDRSEVMGQHHSMFLFEPQCDEFWQNLLRGEFAADIYKRKAKNGSEVWLESNYNPIIKRGRVVNVVEYAQDVTKKELERVNCLGQMEAINRVQAVIEFDREGRILTANDNFLKVVGYQHAEVVGRHHRIFVYPEDSNTKDYEFFWKKLGSGKFDSGTYRRKNKNGGELWLQASYNPIFDVEGKLLKVVKYATDITAATSQNKKLESAFKNLSSVISASEQKAKEANVSVAGMVEVVAQSESIMQDLTNNIEEMSKRADNIKTLTELMDSVAFQTNILAINAKIEAAHAGSKSFSVVAEEIKNLSLKSAESSGEIKDIVAKTVASIAEGLRLIEDANNMSAKTRGSIEITAGIMAEIESSSMKEIKEAMQLLNS